MTPKPSQTQLIRWSQWLYERSGCLIHGRDAIHAFVGCKPTDAEEPRIECGQCQHNGRHTLLSFWLRDGDQVMAESFDRKR